MTLRVKDIVIFTEGGMLDWEHKAWTDGLVIGQEYEVTGVTHDSIRVKGHPYLVPPGHFVPIGEYIPEQHHYVNSGWNHEIEEA